MTADRFDEASRQTAREGPAGVLAWLFGGAAFGARLAFVRWLDTRSASGPGEARGLADLVAELRRLDEPEAPWLVVLESQTEPDPDMFGRLLVELGRAWLELRPDGERGSRYQVTAAVLNLTGTGRSAPASRSFAFPVGGHRVELAVREVYLAEESAGRTLEGIERGDVAGSVLAYVPLMHGGGEDDTIQRWKALAARLPPGRQREGVALAALTLSELVPWHAGWLFPKEWDMRESTIAQEWIEKGVEKGRLLGQIQLLEELLGQPVTPEETLAARGSEELARLAAELRARWKGRGNGHPAG